MASALLTVHVYTVQYMLYRYNIIVTSRAKKDMGETEKAAQKKLQQKTTLHHAEEHR
jgi:hypothetical protein